jgi:hypothetical protein
VVTEEAPDRKGPTDEAVLRGLPPGTPVLTKPVFGLAACPDIMAAISAQFAARQEHRLGLKSMAPAARWHGTRPGM